MRTPGSWELLEAEISEIFESIQGEGILVGVRQLFIRFRRCNLSCSYCDTTTTPDCHDRVNNAVLRNPVSAEYVLGVIEGMTKIHSVSLTGGEPLLYADFIKQLKSPVPLYLESNMTLPDAARKVRNNVGFVAGDFKLSSAVKDWEGIREKTIETFKVLRNTRKRLTFAKIVVPEKFSSDEVLWISEQIGNYVCSIVLQPVFGAKNLKELMELQKRIEHDVRIIPQVHKYLGVM